MRADIARLAVLFHCGGLYADADTRVLRAGPLLDYFEQALLVEDADAVVGTACLPGYMRRWVEATRRPSNILLGCRRGSPFVAEYLHRVVRDFDALRIAERLASPDRRSWLELRRLTMRWAGPQQLRRLIASPGGAGGRVRLTPVGFVACGRQRCFPDAVLAHDYRATWYRASPAWRAARDIALYTFLRTPLDACIVGAFLAALCLALAGAGQR
jgi:hypothetical protein